MLNIFTSMLSNYIHLIAQLGYWGVAIAMLVENSNIPLPSELVLPFIGYLIFLGKLHFTYSVLAGAIGATIGALISYYLGKYVSEIRWATAQKLHYSQKWFDRYGETAVLVCRFIPIVRAIISFPAGANGMNLGKFIFYTFAGGSIWTALMISGGYYLGSEWNAISAYYRIAEWIVIGIILFGIGVLVFRRIHIRPSE